jgi:hypothetical protein
MKQSTLSPYIAPTYRAELERMLDNAVSNLPGILGCGFQNPQPDAYCQHCSQKEIEPEVKPCKYLLVEPENVLTVFRKHIEAFKATITFSPRHCLGTLNRIYGELKNMFDSGLYSFLEKFDERTEGLLESITVHYFDEVKLGAKTAKKERKRETPTTSTHAAKIAIKGILSHLRKVKPEAISELGLPETLPKTSIKEIKEYMGNKLSQTGIKHVNASFEAMKKWYEEEKSSFVQINRKAKILSTHLKKPEIKGEYKTIIVQRGKGSKEPITCNYFTLLEQKRAEEKAKEVQTDNARRIQTLANAKAMFVLDAFSTCMNPLKKHRLLQEQTMDLENRKNELKKELDKVSSPVIRLNERISVYGKSPIEAIMGIPAYCYGELEETIGVIDKKLETRAVEIPMEKLAKSVRKTWKLCKQLEKVERIISDVSKPEEELRHYFPINPSLPVEEKQVVNIQSAQKGPMDLYVV